VAPRDVRGGEIPAAPRDTTTPRHHNPRHHRSPLKKQPEEQPVSKQREPYETLTGQAEFETYCARLAEQPWLGLDTEFVAEHTYRPVLCLVQIASPLGLAVIDPLELKNVAPLWEMLVEGEHETIMHAARSELEFCYHATGRLPKHLIDVQLAAGLIGIEYPAGYNTLIGRLLGQPAGKHETRTDWRRRPLSQRQIDYALDDVRYLRAIRDRIVDELDRLGRRHWLDDEMRKLGEELVAAQTAERWRRVSGNSGLSPRQLAIVREIWRWREQEAEHRDKPVRRVFRDDLIIELARRESADPKRIGAVRGMDRRDLRRHIDKLSSAIRRALSLPDDELPRSARRERSQQNSVLGQFLFAALGSLCREADLAPALVGGPNDIRELIAYDTEAGGQERRVPSLAQGWRKEFVGQLFDDLLAGKVTVSVADARSDSPLRFERTR